jgi:hypothetical protein
MMKNYILFKMCIVLYCICTINAGAQVMGGVFTIDNTQVASATNFTSFTSFAARINTAGVNAPVTVNVAIGSGPYTEQVSFIQAPGISATNTVTVNGNGRTITFNSTSSTSLHTIMLQGADYMTFNDLTIIGTGPSYALTIHLWNQSNFNQFVNCKIYAPIGGTSSSQVPFSMSGSGTSATSSGDHGNSNIVNTCTISGGYYGTVLYGLSGSPYNTDNKILNSYLVDWYIYGIYETYDRSLLIKGNVLERLNLTSASTTYGMYFQNQSPNTIIEANHIRKLFELMPTNGNTAYGIYFTSGGGTGVGQELFVRNNIISDIRSNGAIMAIYTINGSYFIMDHNTISLDDLNSTYSGQTIGFQMYTNYLKIRNNIISLKRGGTVNSNRIGIYIGSPGYLTGFESKNNVFNILGTTGLNSIGYFNAINIPTLPGWQGAVNQDIYSVIADPVFTNPAGGNYVPSSMVINNTAPPIGVLTDFTGAARSTIMPDPGALESYTTPCSSSAGVTGIIAPTGSVCPGNTITLNLGSNTFTNSGYTVQWYSSTVSPLGGYNSISGATLNSQVSAPANVNTYYTAVVTCTNTLQNATTTVGSVLVSSTYTNAVPYFEGFESLSYNTLPNCSWTNTQGNAWPNTTPAATYLQSNNRVPRNGNGYAAFTGTPAATNYYYSNGIWMEPNITYSASLWYINESLNYNPWTDLSMLVGPNQNATGQQLIASSNGPVASVLYSALTNTFSVTAPAFYYVAVRATSAAGNSPYLTWDDLSIIIPCTLNEPQISLTSNKDSICAGQSVNLTANGATTYSWSTGATSSGVSVSPNVTTTYFVTGINGATSCSKTVSKSITVNDLPDVSAVAFPVAVCAGSPANLVAVASNVLYYNWSNGGAAASTVVMPLTNTIYTVTVINASNCMASATLQVTVYAKPSVSLTLNRSPICKGEPVIITGTGASTYSMTSSPSGFIFQGGQVTDYPTQSTVYTITGFDVNGCTNTAIQALPVESCVGITEAGRLGELKVYPNPSSNKIFVEVSSGSQLNLQISDVTGRILYEGLSGDPVSEVNLENLSGGIYYLTVRSENAAEVIKVIKN